MNKDPKYFTKDGLVRSEDNINFGVDYDILAGMYIKLKEDLLKAEAMEDYWKIHSSELNEDITQLKKEIVDLKTEIVDHRVKEYRLTKILNETSDYT